MVVVWHLRRRLNWQRMVEAVLVFEHVTSSLSMMLLSVTRRSRQRSIVNTIPTQGRMHVIEIDLVDLGGIRLMMLVDVDCDTG
jgi:hypothetical protein